VGQPVGARPGWLSSRLGASHGAVAAAVAAGVGAASCHQEEERVAGAQGRRQRQRASGWWWLTGRPCGRRNGCLLGCFLRLAQNPTAPVQSLSLPAALSRPLSGTISLHVS
jgi:hypothetical protein